MYSNELQYLQTISKNIELHFAHFVHCKNEIDESAVMELDYQIETKPQFTEILNDCIDIDDPSSFGGQVVNDTSSFFVQLPDSAETVNQTTQTPPNEMQQWDWSNRIIHPTTRDSSQSQPPITTTSYETSISPSISLNSIGHSNLPGPSNFLNFQGASPQSQDDSDVSVESAKDRSSAMIIDESENDMMYLKNKDIDVSLLLESQMDASFLNVTTTTQDVLITTKTSRNKMLHFNSSMQMFQDRQDYSNDESDNISFPINRKPMFYQCNANNGMALTNLGNPGNSSRQSALSENASQKKSQNYQGEKTPLGATPIIKPSEVNSFMVIDDSDDMMDEYNTTLLNPPDEPIICRQKAANVIESSDDDNDAMDVSFESGDVNSLGVQEPTPAPSTASSPIIPRLYLPNNLPDATKKQKLDGDSSQTLFTVPKKSKKTKLSVQYVVGVPYSLKFFDGAINDGKKFEYEIDEDGCVSSLQFTLAKWENVIIEKQIALTFPTKPNKTLRRLINRDEVVVTDSPCTGFAITIDNKNYAIACPHRNLKTLDTTQILPHKANTRQGEWVGLQSFCVACSSYQNNMRGNLINVAKKQNAINNETGCFHCGKIFVGDPYVYTIQDNERKFFNAEHKETYLKGMKDAAKKVKSAREGGTMCRNCTKPWNADDGACIVGDNGLKYHNQACYQAYLDSIEKVSTSLPSLSKSEDPEIGSMVGVMACAKRKVDIGAWIDNTGANLAARSGDNGWSRSQAIAILYHIALTGEFVATDLLFPLELLTADEITAACRRLEEEDFHCYWCGVNLTFLQQSGYSQFSPDRLFNKQYYEVGQTTVRSCIHCQFFFNDASLEKRESFIDELLSNKYRPDLADKAVEFYETHTNDEEARSDGILRSEEYLRYWTTKFNSQSFEKRKDWTKTNWTNVTEDIRDWKKEQCCEFGRLLDNRCSVTGFSIDDVNESISIDRIWDDGHYTESDVMLLWWPCNDSKGKVSFFKTKEAFLDYKTLMGLDGLSHRKAAVLIIREALERLRTFQREKRDAH